MNLYLLAIVPTNSILKVTQEFRAKYAQFSKQQIDPHITIHPPFYPVEISEADLFAQLQSLFAPTLKFTVVLKSVNYFQDRRSNVAYFEPDFSSSVDIKQLATLAFEALNSKVKNVFSDYNYSPENFVPHLTIAEKITPQALPQIKQELSAFNQKLTFEVSSLWLFKHQESIKGWSRIQEIKFNQS